jgi:GntR family transcriptional regulator / MocR family aminotransferase
MRGNAQQMMWQRLFRRSNESTGSLQYHIRQMLVSAVMEKYLPPGDPTPSSRELSEILGVARNTVVLAYQQLVDEGFLVSRERSGYYVSENLHAGWAKRIALPERMAARGVDWSQRFKRDLSRQRNITKPHDWQSYPYAFVYGQFDPTLFPVADWRECCRMALSVNEIRGWASDWIDEDDPLLIEQLRTRILPRRGVWAKSDEIMITVGAQQALFLLAELLISDRCVMGVESPGYPDARNIFSLKNPRLKMLAVDEQGVVPDETLSACDYVYVTPSHQCPTTVTLPLDRRMELLRLARAEDIVIIEDDYEIETNFADQPVAALKSLDADGRVVYVGSLSKTLTPGLRIGYLVAPNAVIRQARALRRLMVRHPPVNNQRAAAFFLSLGHHDAFLHRTSHVMKTRRQALLDAIAECLPGFSSSHQSGGSSCWVTGPEWLDACRLAEAAKASGVIIEPGEIFFAADNSPRHHFRLGFSSIPQERIHPGICKLAEVHRGLPRA